MSEQRAHDAVSCAALSGVRWKPCDVTSSQSIASGGMRDCSYSCQGRALTSNLGVHGEDWSRAEHACGCASQLCKVGVRT